jgi:hypothetical protein
MHVVLLDTQLTRPPVADPACFIQELFQADNHFTSQYTLTIFRYPHQVLLQAVFRMGPGLVSSHGQIMSEFAPLRQIPPAEASKGCHSSPGLKAWGFLSMFDKLLITVSPSRFMSKFLHQLHLDLLDFQKPLPLIHKKVIHFLMQMTNL